MDKVDIPSFLEEVKSVVGDLVLQIILLRCQLKSAIQANAPVQVPSKEES